MGCGCEECIDQYKLPIGPKGDKGDPGPKGDTGKDGVCVPATNGIIYSNFGAQNSPNNTFSNFEYSNFTNTIPPGTLSKDGDVIIIRMGLSKFGQTSPHSFRVYFDSVQISYNFGTDDGGSLGFASDIELKISRKNSTTFVATGQITMFGNVNRDASNNIIGAAATAIGANPSFYSRIEASGYDFAGTGYDIKVEADAPTGFGVGSSYITLEHMIIEKIDRV